MNYDRPYRDSSAVKKKPGDENKKGRRYTLAAQIAVSLIAITAAIIFRTSDTADFAIMREKYTQAMAQQINIPIISDAMNSFSTQISTGMDVLPTSQAAEETEQSKAAEEEENTVSAQEYVPVDFALPVMGSVSSEYGPRTNDDGETKQHKGIDIAANFGDPISPVMDGIVTAAGENDSYGIHFVVDHKNGFVTRYAHCSSLQVEKGDRVKADDVAAFVGSTGDSTGPHLHFEVQFEGVVVDPEPFLRKALYQ